MLALSITLAGGLLPAAATDSRMDEIRKVLQEKTGQAPDEETLKLIEQSLENDPHNASAHLTLALCYDRMGLPDLAAQEYLHSVESEPNDAKALLEIIRGELKDGHTYTAMKLLQATSKKFANDADVLFWKANYLVSMQHSTEAAKMLANVLSKKTNVLGVASALAELELDHRRYGDALNLANRELENDANYWLAYSIKGMALAGLQKYDQAIPPLQRAFTERPFKSKAAITYAQCASWMGDYKTALDPALVYVALESSWRSNNLQQKELLVHILRRLPQDFVAERLAYWGPKFDNILNNAAFHFLMGDVLDSVDMHAVAIDEYKAGLKMQPNFARAIFHLGKDLELDKRQYKAALDCYERAHTLAPDDKEMTVYWTRLQGRLPVQQSDMAWQLRDWLSDLQATTREIK
jgi:tetratricopeptide (TPR) repeat protein